MISEKVVRFGAAGLVGILSEGEGELVSMGALAGAGALLAILPPLLLFVALNRYYVRGLFLPSEESAAGFWFEMTGAAVLAVLTTLGIILSLVIESLAFFSPHRYSNR